MSAGADTGLRALPLVRGLLCAWGVVLVLAVTWPFLLVFAPGRSGDALALRDMMVLERPYLTHSSLGFGDLPGRGSPQDAVLAAVGTVVPATWFVAAAVVASAGAAAWVGYRAGLLAGARAGTRRVPGPERVPETGLDWGRTLGAAAAMTVAVWNPFVVERLLQGQWSLAMAAWLMPAVALCRGPGKIAAMWGASLTPTGGLFALITGAATAWRTRWFWPAVGTGVILCAPWVLPSLIGALGSLSPGASLPSTAGTASAASAHAFAPRAESHAATLGSLMGLGGIWNGQAVPPSRETGFAVFGIVLFILLAVVVATDSLEKGKRRRVPAPLLVLAAIGFAVPLIGWLAPGLIGWLVETVPGAGLLRDSQKFLALALPAFVLSAGALGRIDTRLAGAALACALLQVPDAPRALAPLAPVPVSVPDVDHRGRDVFFVGRPALVDRGDGIPVVDPATKAMNVVESGELVVDGVVADAASPRWRAANEIFATDSEATEPEATEFDPAVAAFYSDPMVGLVVHPDSEVEDTGIPARPRSALGLGLLVLWFTVPLAAAVAAILTAPARRDRRKGAARPD